MYQKSNERVRIGHCKTEVPIATFLAEVAGKEDRGIPAFSSTIGGFQVTFLNGVDLLNFHASHEDPEADNGPYLFAVTKDGTIAWPTTTPFGVMQRTLMDTVADLSFNEDITKKEDVLDNAVICVGALWFNYPDDRRKGECVIVESYYIEPTLR